MLIAEDNQEMAAYIASLLSSFCQTQIAQDGDEALQMVRDWAPDLVLTDVMMPRRSGLELCRAVKSDHGTISIPVVLLTAVTHREAMLKGWEAGADEYLFKPFHPTELVTRIKSLLSSVNDRNRAELLARQTEELERSNSELEQFAYVASHDLQEPLRMVTSYCDLLQRRYAGKLDADADEFMGYAVDGATRMGALVKDLLAYSRVSTRSQEVEEADLNGVLERALSNLSLAIQDSAASVAHDPLPTVIGGATQLEQLLQNLIGNAIKFHGAEPPIVHVSAKQNKNHWLFSVTDNGIGIEEQYADKIFVVFQRLHKRHEYVGTGVGLAICKKIVERHGGKIWFESEPGNGSTFYFTMPIVKGGDN